MLVRAWWRKQWYGWKQRGVLETLQTTLDQRYYLAILQVYNDSQIRNHSPYADVRDYINDVMFSFSRKRRWTMFWSLSIIPWIVAIACMGR
jgi:capsular polysaccharide export protein